MTMKRREPMFIVVPITCLFAGLFYIVSAILLLLQTESKDKFTLEKVKVGDSTNWKVLYNLQFYLIEMEMWVFVSAY